MSLHAPDEETRRRIIPTAHAHPIADILAALRTWQDAVARRVTVEYTLLRGINDRAWQAELLAERLKDLRVHVNLIPFNPWPDSGFEASTRREIESFKGALERSGLRGFGALQPRAGRGWRLRSARSHAALCRGPD